MQQFQKTRLTVLSNYQEINTVAAIPSTDPVDIRGVGEVVIDIVINSVATSNMTNIKLIESETATGTYTDVANGAFTVFPVFGATDAGKVWRIHAPVAQRNYKSFLKVSYTKGDTNVARVTTIANATALNQGPTGSTANGAAQTIVA
jgi:hypothetical protein